MQTYNIYKDTTRRIVNCIMEGDIPWRRPFYTVDSKGKINYVSRIPYKGINKLLLPEEGEYVTFKQAEKHNGKINKGSHGYMIVKTGRYIPEKNKAEAEKLKAEGKNFDHLYAYYLKKATVFKLSDTTGLPSKLIQGEMKAAENPTDMADFIIEDYKLRRGFNLQNVSEDECRFDTDSNTVYIPQKERFITEEEYYNAVICGMMRSAIDRREDDPRKKDEAKDELVIEIGASMVLNGVGLRRKEATENTSAKVKEWVRALNNDYRLIFTASREAEKIAREILQPLLGQDDEEDTDETS